MFDGDITFGLSMGAKTADINTRGVAVAEAVAQAVLRAIRFARRLCVGFRGWGRWQGRRQSVRKWDWVRLVLRVVACPGRSPPAETGGGTGGIWVCAGMLSQFQVTRRARGRFA